MTSNSNSGIIDLPLIERITLDSEVAFARCFIENTPNGKALFVRKKDETGSGTRPPSSSSSSSSSSDGSDSYRISNTVAVLGPPSPLKRKVVDLLLFGPQQPRSPDSPQTASYAVRNYAAGWSSGVGVSYSNETHLAVLDVPTDGYPHKVALPTLFALSVSQAVLVVCAEVTTPSTLPDTAHCALLHGIAKSVASLPEPHSSKFQSILKERPTFGFVLPHFAPCKSEALLEAWANSAQRTTLFAHSSAPPFFRIPIVPEWQHKIFMFAPITPAAQWGTDSQQDPSVAETAFRKNVLEGMLHEQKTGMVAAKTWCAHVADVACMLTPSGQNLLGLAVADALKAHVSGALRASMVICSRAVREARQFYASELPSGGGHSRETHEKHVEKALQKFRSVAAGIAIDDYTSYLQKKLLNEWVSQKTY